MKIKRLLDIKKISKNSTYNFSPNSTAEINLENKIQELILLLESTHLTRDQIKTYQNRISNAFENAVHSSNPIKPFTKLNRNQNLSREELLDDFERLLSQNQIDSNIGKKYIRKNALQKFVVCLIATVLIAAGFAMIIMPAPPSFELFTIFYFNPNDGVTVMDLVSLLIILSGVFLFVLTFSKK